MSLVASTSFFQLENKGPGEEKTPDRQSLQPSAYILSLEPPKCLTAEADC